MDMDIDIDTKPGQSAVDLKTEAVIARVWRDVLGLTEVGPDDNFYGAGGDSYYMMEIVSRLYELGLRFDENKILRAGTLDDWVQACVV